MSNNDVPTLAEWADNNGSGNLGFDLDPELYLVHLAGMDISVAQKIELIKVLLAMMENFVDRAFGDDPVQQARKAVGEPHLDDASIKRGVADSRIDIPNTKHLSGAFQRHVAERLEKEDSTR